MPQLVSDDDAIPCPACGYDLRGRAGDKCSECGAACDPQSLASSQIPWVRRREMGRFRSYLKTLWLVLIDARRLRYETSRPHNWTDARSFLAITAALVALSLSAAFIMLSIAMQGLEFLAYEDPEPLFGQANPRWWADAAAPWSAAATIPGIIPAMLLGLGYHIVASPLRLISRRDLSPQHRQRLRAAACYASASLVLLAPVAAMAGAVHILASDLLLMPREAEYCLWSLAAGATLVVLLSILRISQWLTRARRAGLPTLLLSALFVPAAWLIGAIAWLAILPWCLGLIWIIIDSFRS